MVQFVWNSSKIAILENLNLKGQKFEKRLGWGENEFLWKFSYFYKNIYIYWNEFKESMIFENWITVSVLRSRQESAYKIYF